MHSVSDVMEVIKELRDYDRDEARWRVLSRAAVDLAREAGEAAHHGDTEQAETCRLWAEQLQERAERIKENNERPSTGSGKIFWSNVQEMLRDLKNQEPNE